LSTLALASFTAFYDANVLYGSALRNFLMRLALTGLFLAKWSAGVHEEWMSKLGCVTLVSATDVRGKLDQVKIPRLPNNGSAHTRSVRHG